MKLWQSFKNTKKLKIIDDHLFTLCTKTKVESNDPAQQINRQRNAKVLYNKNGHHNDYAVSTPSALPIIASNARLSGIKDNSIHFDFKGNENILNKINFF